MKLKDYILQSVYSYPGLFLTGTFEQSRILVLDHLFLVNGNGIEWAYTKDPAKGGYLVHPNHYKKNGEWERKLDKPYGKEKFEMDWEDIIGNSATEYLNNDFGELEGNKMGFSEDLYKKIINERLEKINNFSWLEKHKRTPYPHYDKGWPFNDIKTGSQKLGFVKPDWLEGMIDIKLWALDFYKNKEKYHNDRYFGSRENIHDKEPGEGHRKNIEPKLKSGEYKNWKEVLEAYGVKEDIKENDYANLAYTGSENRRLKYIEELEEALNILKS